MRDFLTIQSGRANSRKKIKDFAEAVESLEYPGESFCFEYDHENEGWIRVYLEANGLFYETGQSLYKELGFPGDKRLRLTDDVIETMTGVMREEIEELGEGYYYVFGYDPEHTAFREFSSKFGWEYKRRKRNAQSDE